MNISITDTLQSDKIISIPLVRIVTCCCTAVIGNVSQSEDVGPGPDFGKISSQLKLYVDVVPVNLYAYRDSHLSIRDDEISWCDESLTCRNQQ